MTCNGFLNVSDSNVVNDNNHMSEPVGTVAFVIGIRLLIRNTTKNVVFVDEFIIIYF